MKGLQNLLATWGKFSLNSSVGIRRVGHHSVTRSGENGSVHDSMNTLKFKDMLSYRTHHYRVVRFVVEFGS
jgi:hypothetical protein